MKVAWILSYCCAYRKLVFVIFLLEKINNSFEVVTIILKLAKPNLNIPKLTAPNSPNLNLFIFVFPCLNEKQFSSLSSHPFLLSMTAYETPISSASPITLSTIFCAPPRVCFTLVHSLHPHPQKTLSYSYTLVLFPTDATDKIIMRWHEVNYEFTLLKNVKIPLFSKIQN